MKRGLCYFPWSKAPFAGWTLFGVLFLGAVQTACLGGAIRVNPRGQRRPPGGDMPSEDPAARVPVAAIAHRRRRMRTAILAAEAVLFAVMVVHAVIRNRQHLENAYDPNEFAEAGGWLEAHSRPGEIVYNVHWDTFPKLFLWDQKNAYVSGMDPIFQYVIDPSLYYKSFYLYIGKASV